MAEGSASDTQTENIYIECAESVGSKQYWLVSCYPFVMW